MRPDSLLRLWRYINHLLTYLLTYLLKANDANSPLPNFHSHSPFSLSLRFLSFPFRPLSLHSPFHSPFPITLPKGLWEEGTISSGSGPQTHFDASTGLKNAPRRGSIFQLPPTFPMTQIASLPLDLDAPGTGSKS